jgi:hypothetical protein
MTHKSNTNNPVDFPKLETEMNDTSDDPKLDQEISIFLTPDDLREVIASLTEALEKNEQPN